MLCIQSWCFSNSFVGDTERKEWAIDPMRSAEDKNIIILRDLLVRVLNSISSGIVIVTRNCFLYVRT
jgi:hypothetical protein